MKLRFYKYQATGNDFVMVDNTEGLLRFPETWVAHICDRHFGVGADGLIALEKDPEGWVMAYYNADGRPGSFCGNGSRCFALFMVHEGLADTGYWINYRASDGSHRSRVLSEDVIETEMRVIQPPYPVHLEGLEVQAWLANTGSPHVMVLWPEDPYRMESEAFTSFSKRLRHHPLFQPGGVNVNLVHAAGSGLWIVRTYERGVEAETLSCGTGLTATACLARQLGHPSPVTLQTAGGLVQVETTGQDSALLRGPARRVFEGIWG
jgi:diaminopimelate epimerase